jgi:N-acetylglucosaminyl-diphospho-decaprenol L-rhamnosyltransferase
MTSRPLVRAHEPRLTILVVSYNTRVLTLACLDSVRAHTVTEETQVIVVDNASTDGSADAIAAAHPSVELLRSPQNLGFASANNLGAEAARGERLLLLNPDTVLGRESVAALLAFAARTPSAGIWGGRTTFADGTPNPSSCWRRATIWSELCATLGLAALARGNRMVDPEVVGDLSDGRERAVDIVSGCFLMLDLATWRRLGGFDPRFFMYGEDADLCLRARRLGCQPAVDPTATIIHLGGASEPSRAEKLCKLLYARAQLARAHSAPLAAALQVALLRSRPWSRAMCWTALAALGRRDARERAATWHAVARGLARCLRVGHYAP